VRAELVLDCRNVHGEGVLWDARAGRLRWTDIHGRALWSCGADGGGVERVEMPDRVCAFAPRDVGGLIVAFADRIALLDDHHTEERVLALFEPENPETRLNDGRTDRQGRFVVGGMNEGSGRADSTVVRVGPDLSVETLFDGVSCANATCFSPDGRTMYFTDSPERKIRAYPYDPAAGALGEPRLLADLAQADGVPDGACVDAEGGVWCAIWEGHRVIRVAPDGTVDQTVEVPVWKPTCCAFGGEDLRTLFITTSRLGTEEGRLAEEPLSGGLFACRPGPHGIEDSPFAG
jgi:L-arabinonolactonase